MNPMIPSLHGSKMSSSHPPNTKIMFLDDAEVVKKKVLEAPWPGLDTTKNGVLSLLKNVLIPVAQFQLEQRNATGASDINGAVYTNGDTIMATSVAEDIAFTIEVDGKRRIFSSYNEVGQSLADGSIQPDAVKIAVAKGITDLLNHVRKMFENDLEWQIVDKLAYPETT